MPGTKEPAAPSVNIPNDGGWEKANSLLADALSIYAYLSTALQMSPKKEDMTQKLALRIDAALESLDTTRLALQKLRNQTVPPTSRLPEELLVRIFEYSVFSYPELKDSVSVSMRSTVINIYRSLYCLFGVCSSWRTILLSRGTFWSIIPELFEADYLSTHEPIKKPNMDLILGRAGNCGLHLAVQPVYHRINRYNYLRAHAFRLHAINLISYSNQNINSMLNILFGSSVPDRLSELSICRKPDLMLGYQNSNTSRPTLSHNILQSVPVIRLRGVELDSVEFSGRLTTLHLQDLKLGSDTAMINTLSRALSAAIRLRNLTFISLLSSHATSFPSSDACFNSSSNILLPSLESLLVYNLHENTLVALLNSIVCPAYRLTLHLTSLCGYFYSGSKPEKANINDLCETLDTMPIYMLCISQGPNWERISLTDPELISLMKSTASMEVLKINDSGLAVAFLRVLEQLLSMGTPFPNLTELNLNRVGLTHEHLLMMLLSAHSRTLRRVQLVYEGLVGTNHTEGELIEWLRAHIPDFSLKDRKLKSLEFRWEEWQLW